MIQPYLDLRGLCLLEKGKMSFVYVHLSVWVYSLWTVKKLFGKNWCRMVLILARVRPNGHCS
jgi:hypothetical protein